MPEIRSTTKLGSLDSINTVLTRPTRTHYSLTTYYFNSQCHQDQLTTHYSLLLLTTHYLLLTTYYLLLTRSVIKTNRLVTVEEGWPSCGIGAEIGKQ